MPEKAPTKWSRGKKLKWRKYIHHNNLHFHPWLFNKSMFHKSLIKVWVKIWWETRYLQSLKVIPHQIVFNFEHVIYYKKHISKDKYLSPYITFNFYKYIINIWTNSQKIKVDARVCMCVYMCVYKRERENKREILRYFYGLIWLKFSFWFLLIESIIKIF